MLPRGTRRRAGAASGMEGGAMKPNRRRSSLVRLLTPRGGEAGREAGRPSPLLRPPSCPVPPRTLLVSTAPGSRAGAAATCGPGPAELWPPPGACRVVPSRAASSRAARPRGDSPAGARAPLPPRRQEPF